MSARKTLFQAVLGAALAMLALGIVVGVASFLRDRRRAAMDTADEIRAKLDELDPVSRAAVRASLTADAARSVRPRLRRGAP